MIRVEAATVHEPHVMEMGYLRQEDDGQGRQVDDKVSRIVFGVKAGQNEPAEPHGKKKTFYGSCQKMLSEYGGYPGRSA